MANRDLYKLVVRMEAENKKLHTDLQRSTREIKKFRGNVKTHFGAINKSFQTFAKFAAGGAVAALTARFAQASQQSVELADNIAKTARLAGVSGEELQKLRLAAELGGTSAGNLDTALTALSKRLGELKNDTGALYTFLRKYDEALLSNLQSTRDTSQAIDLIAERMRLEGDQAQRAALASAAFSRRNITLVNTLSQGSEALKTAKNQLKDFIPNSVLANAEALNDRVTIASRTIEVKWNKALLTAAPLIVKVREYLADLANQWADIADFYFTDPGQRSNLLNLKSDAALLREEIAQLQKDTHNTFKMFLKGNYIDKQLREKVDEYNAINQRIKELEVDLSPPKPSRIPPVAAPSTDSSAAPPATTPQIRKKIEEVKAVPLALAEATEQAGLSINETINEKMLNPVEQLKQRWTDSVTAMQYATVTFAERSADALADFATKGKIDFHDLSQSIIRDLIEIAIKKAAVGIFGGYTSASYGTTPGSPQTTMLAQQDVGLRAHGGPVAAATPYWVGEKGPELFIPDHPGHIVANSPSTRGAPVNITQKFDFSGANPATLALLRQGADKIKQETIATLIGLRRSGALPDF